MMKVKNSYPELPEIAYLRTKIGMPLVVLFARTLVGKYLKEVVRTAYVIFRNESANGNSGVNNNYIGEQADVGKWEGLDMTNVVGTCVKTDNADDTRRFICFNENGYKDCFAFLCYKVFERKMYIGAPGIVNADDLYEAYQKLWVSNPKEDTADARKDFKSLYNSSLTAIS